MPISLDLWLTFCVASAFAIAIPGPTMLLAIGNSLGSGPRIGFASLLGVGAADAAGMTVSVLGLSALLATVSLAFEIVKWLGAAYLVWLGIQLWRAPVAGLDARPEKRRTASRAITQAFIAHLLNPKGILFFGAFLPQFIDTATPCRNSPCSASPSSCSISRSCRSMSSSPAAAGGRRYRRCGSAASTAPAAAC